MAPTDESRKLIKKLAIAAAADAQSTNLTVLNSTSHH
jgi:hypothetical protein